MVSAAGAEAEAALAAITELVASKFNEEAPELRSSTVAHLETHRSRALG